MNPEDLTIADIKNCMMLLPYSRKMNANLIVRYTREGMSQCADAIRLDRFVCAGTSDEVLTNMNRPAFQDAVRAGESSNALVRVILAANGGMPTKEEPAGDLYARALSEYTTNTMEGAKSPVFQALEQSVNADTLNLCGAVMRRLGYYELGAVLCRQAYTCRPNHPYALINEALCMEVLKKQENAKSLASLALKNSGLDAWGRSEATRIINGVQHP
jgi:tetratricopeptide (TPR) repeat protein